MESSKDDLLLATSWPLKKVRNCLERDDKDELIHFLERRYDERFLTPIRLLTNASGNWHGYGFSIMALCSLLIETIQSLWEGLPSTNKSDLAKLKKGYSPPMGFEVPEVDWPRRGGDLFVAFFSNPLFSDLFPGVDGVKFYSGIRCGLLHQAQTKDGFAITALGQKLWDDNGPTINRDLFSQSVRISFFAYTSLLGMPRVSFERWARARRKIWWMMELS